MAETHSINRQRFDIQYHNQNNTHQLQNKLSTLATGALKSLIQSILDEFSDEEFTIQLNQIELSLGHIKEEDLEAEILERVRRQLHDYLSEAIAELRVNPQSDKGGILSHALRKIDLLAYFLLNGALPWWSASMGNVNLQSLIKELLQGHSKELIALVRKHGSQRQFVQRLVITFDDATIFSLIEKLEPSEAKVIIEIGKDTIRFQQESQIVKTDQITFRNKVWEFILTYLLNDRGSFFNTKDFVRSLLHQLAGHFNVHLAQLLSQFYKAVLSLTREVPQTQGLAYMIKDIYLTEVDGSGLALSPTSTPQKAKALSSTDFMKLLASDAFNLADISLTPYRTTFELLLLQQDPELKRILLKKARSDSSRKILNQLQLSVPAKKQLTDLNKEAFVFLERYYLEQEGLFEYLQTGSLSLIYAGLSMAELTNCLVQLIQEKKAEFRNLIVKHGTKEAFRERLLSHLEESQIKKLLVLVEPTGAKAIQEFADNIQTIKEEGQLDVSVSHGDFKKLKWRFIFQALLVDRGSRFNLKSFIKSALWALASHLNIAPQLFITQALTQLKRLSSHPVAGDLTSVLTELQKEEAAGIKSKRAKKRVRVLKLTKLRWLEYVISRSGLPWWGKAHGLDTSLFQEVLFEISISYPKRVLHLLQTELVKDHKRRATLKMLNDEGKIGIIKLLQPEALESILFYTQTLKQLEKKTDASSEKLDIQKWDVIIFALISDRGSVFNLKSFIMNTLHKLAHHFSLNFDELFSTLFIVSTEISGNQKSEFKLAMLSLKSDFEAKSDKAINLAPSELSTERATDSPEHKAIQWLATALADFYTRHTLDRDTKLQLLLWFKTNKHLPFTTLVQVFRQAGFSKQDLQLFFQQFTKTEQEQLSAIAKSPKALWTAINKRSDSEDSSKEMEVTHSPSLRASSSSFRQLILDHGTTANWSATQKERLSQWFHQHAGLKQTDLLWIFKQASLSTSDLSFLFKQFPSSKKALQVNQEKLLASYQNMIKVPTDSKEQSTQKTILLTGLTQIIAQLRREILWVFTEKHLLFSWLKNNATVTANDLIKAFRESGLTDAEFQLIFRQFGLSEQLLLLKRLGKNENMFLESYHADLLKVLRAFPGIQMSSVKSMLQAHGLHYILTNPSPDKHSYLKQILVMLMKEWHLSWQELTSHFSASADRLRDQLESTIVLSYHRMENNITKPEGEPSKLSSPSPNLEEASELTDRQTEAPNDQDMELEEEILEEGVFIDNAGLVILWPFFTPYFQRLGLLENEQFVNKEASIRAVHLLQYLVTGHESSQEYELYLNKVLCGIKPGTPLAPLELTTEEKELSESLLGGVIGNWTNMSDTSVEALRETFLVRPGHLIPGEEFWSLKVERNTLDMLMESMPWSYSVIQLPWMEKIIHVTW